MTADQKAGGGRPSIGLCMIVRNESHVIERCLDSIRAHLDHWVIVDTGSTDGTQELVRTALSGIPGFLLERPWVDFGHNRTEALAAARPHADYTFVIDADEVLVVPADFRWPPFSEDSVSLIHRTDETTYWRPSLVANRLPWSYRGVLHEYLTAPGATTQLKLSGPEVVGHFDGGRSRGITSAEKYARDARVLLTALEDDPGNARYQYYLARSYRDSDQNDLALVAFRRRAEMGDFDEEVYDSLYWVAKLLERIGAGTDEIVTAYQRAWEQRPTRAEPLAALARFLRVQNRFALARMVAGHAMTLERPDDLLWVEEDVYAWRCRDEYAVASYWTGHYGESAAACLGLLEDPKLPEAERERIVKNLEFAVAKLPTDAAGDALIPRQINGLASSLLP